MEERRLQSVSLRILYITSIFMYIDYILFAEGISGGGIAGIVIAVCAVFGLSAGLVLMLKNRDWDVKRLVPNLPARGGGGGSRAMTSFSNMSYNSSTGAVNSS